MQQQDRRNNLTVQQKAKESAEVKQSCAFQPKINPKSNKILESKEDEYDLTANKWQQLHLKASDYHSRKKVDRDADAIEYVKSALQFTFTPKIMGDVRAGSQLPLFAELKAEQNCNKKL